MDALLLRVAGHVFTAMADGTLPRLPWDHRLRADERDALRQRWPDATSAWSPSSQDSPAPHPLLHPLRDLLERHRTADPATGVWANVLAAACFGPHHLWQDLGASGRADVSRLMAWGLPGLHASNVRDLRWKRHLFLTLGGERGEDDLRPPKCDACDQFTVCFADPPAGSIPVVPVPGEA